MPSNVYVLVVGFTVIPAIAGGWFGWHIGTQGLYLREMGESYGYMEIPSAVLLRRKLKRVIWTVIGTASGAAVGVGILMALAR
mgnify:CR=1 FL=1